MNESNKLKLLKGEEGIPEVYHFLQIKEINYMVMELLNYSIEELLNICGRNISLKTVLMLGIQMVLFFWFILKSNNFENKKLLTKM